MKPFNLLLILIAYLYLSCCKNENTSTVNTTKSTTERSQSENTEHIEKAITQMSKKLGVEMDKKTAQAKAEQMTKELQWEKVNPEKAKVKRDMGRLYLTAYENLVEARSNEDERNALLESALSKYESIKIASPDWKPKLVNARIKSTKQKITMHNKRK